MNFCLKIVYPIRNSLKSWMRFKTDALTTLRWIAFPLDRLLAFSGASVQIYQAIDRVIVASRRRGEKSPQYLLIDVLLQEQRILFLAAIISKCLTSFSRVFPPLLLFVADSALLISKKIQQVAVLNENATTATAIFHQQHSCHCCDECLFS